MSQPPAPSPTQDTQPPTGDTTNPPQDPDRLEAETRLKGLIKDTILEVISEHEAAPPKGKTGKVDVLQLLFGPSK